MNPKIFITQRIPDSGPNLLKAYDLDYNCNDGVLPKEVLIKRLQGKNIVLCLLTDKMDEEVFDRCPDIKMVANYAVGYNNIDIEAAKKRGVIVTNTPGVLDQTTADLAFSLIMSVGRRILEADRYMRSKQFKAWEPMGFLGFDIYGATLGIIGMGRIGSEVARRGSKGFGMKILYTDSAERNDLDFDAEKVTLNELLKSSDFISIHVPLLESTKHLISADEFKIMKNTSYLINTSRGPVVDEKALYEALQNRDIAGAGLDVFEKEPEFYPGLETLENIVMVPHIGSASIQTRQKMSLLAAQNILDFIQGKEPRTKVIS